MLDGLRELEQRLSSLGIAFIFTHGDPGNVIPEIIDDSGAGMLIADFSPLRIANLEVDGRRSYRNTVSRGERAQHSPFSPLLDRVA